MSPYHRSEPAEPQLGEFIQLLGPDGELTETVSRVKTVVSYDRRQELWEVVDSMNQVRVITAGEPESWLEVDIF